MTPEDNAAFLRDLVKGSRQKIHHLKWVDRDGVGRLTALSVPEMTRLTALGQAQGVSPAEMLRRAAHVPVAKHSGSPRALAGAAPEQTGADRPSVLPADQSKVT